MFCARCASVVNDNAWACDTCGRDTMDAGRVLLVNAKRPKPQRRKSDHMSTLTSAMAGAQQLPF